MRGGEGRHGRCHRGPPAGEAAAAQPRGVCGSSPSGLSTCRFSGANPSQFTSVLLPRDDAFSDSLSQKADSEASSGPLLDDKASSKNDLQSPTEHISDYGFGGVMGR